MAVAAHVDSSPAAWLLDQKREWYDLAAGGPLGCERYARSIVCGIRDGTRQAGRRCSPPIPQWTTAGVGTYNSCSGALGPAAVVLRIA